MPPQDMLLPKVSPELRLGSHLGRGCDNHFPSTSGPSAARRWPIRNDEFAAGLPGRQLKSGLYDLQCLLDEVLRAVSYRPLAGIDASETAPFVSAREATVAGQRI